MHYTFVRAHMTSVRRVINQFDIREDKRVSLEGSEIRAVWWF